MVVTRINGVAVHHFRGPPKAKKAGGNDNPEHQLQMLVVRYLDAALPADHKFTANAAGVRVSMHVATLMKAAGVRRGWPDIQILFPNNVTRYIELKADGSLRPEQKQFRDQCLSVPGRDIWSLARSVEDVHAALLRWRVPVRCGVDGGNRYKLHLTNEG